MRTLRKTFLGTLGGLGAALAGVRRTSAVAADAYSLRLSHSISDASSEGMAARRFAAGVERRSNGQVKIEVFPNNTIAKEPEAIDGLTTGVIDFAIAQSAFIERLAPQFQVLGTPFLFKDVATLYRILDGPIGDELFAMLESKGVVGLGWGDNGFQQIQTATKSIVAPDDLKGVRVRVTNGAISVATFQALGAIPVVIDASEVVTALTQHTVEGTAVSLNGFTSNKWYAVLKHVAMTNHVPSVNPILGSKRKLDTLPAPLQRIIKEEAKAAIPGWRAQLDPKNSTDVQVLKQNGVTFTEVQYPLFRKAMDPVFAVVQSKVGGTLLDRIAKAANSA